VRVLVLTPYRYGEAPGPRSSIELWERVLRPAGITYDYAPFESENLHEIIYEPDHTAEKVTEMLRCYARRVLQMRRLRDYDAVLVYREAALIGPALLERIVAARKPIIYQLDDPLYIPYRSPSNGYLSYLKVFGKVGTICRLASVTIVNSRQHRQYAERFTSSIVEVPSVVDGEEYSYEPRNPRAKPVCIGWSGSHSTRDRLHEIGDVLADVSRRDDVTMRFIGSTTFDLPGVAHEARSWNPKTEVEDLRSFDIGLVPLPTDGWTKRKFYLKLVQYMALGIPAVATPLGSNPDVIQHGVNGFLARTPADWRRALQRLVDDDELRARMGEAAAHTAHARYTLQANADRIIEAHHSVLSARVGM